MGYSNYRKILALCFLWVAIVTGGVFSITSLAGVNHELPSTVVIGKNSPETTSSSTTPPVAQLASQPSRGSRLSTSSPVLSCTAGELTHPAAVNLYETNPGLTINTATQGTYKIYGNNTAEIRSQMYTCSPVIEGSSRFAASTDYALNWSFMLQGDGNDMCSITNVRVGLAVAQTYPDWQPSANTTSQATTAWQVFSANLHIHENGHTNLNVLYANQLLNTLESLQTNTCSNLRAEADRATDALIVRLNQAHEEYDRTTNHGATQGAVL